MSVSLFLLNEAKGAQVTFLVTVSHAFFHRWRAFSEQPAVPPETHTVAETPMMHVYQADLTDYLQDAEQQVTLELS